MHWVGHGVTREVFLTRRFAIKLPKLTNTWRHFLQGLLANMQEREFSTSQWPELCPVVFSTWGGWLVVMRRARPLTDAEWNVFNFMAFADKPDYVVPVEDKRNSFGVLDGRVVAVDYGN